MNTHSSFLKEMGITEWMSRDAASPESQPSRSQSQPILTKAMDTTTSTPQVSRPPNAHWLFFGGELKGDAQALFQNILRVLGLSRNEWSWNSPSENIAKISSSDLDIPVVAVAFGGPVAQKITSERDPLPQLRETILALNIGNEHEIPVVATLDLGQLASKSKDKALLWQDLLLAKSVLQNS